MIENGNQNDFTTLSDYINMNDGLDENAFYGGVKTWDDMQNSQGFGSRVRPYENLDGWGKIDDAFSTSSVDELRTALLGLTGRRLYPNLEMNYNDLTGLATSAHCASYIAMQFNGVNQSISSAWDNVSNFTNQTNGMVEDAMRRFTNELRWFIESTQTLEAKALKAANTANDLSGQLLKDLQSSFETFYSNNQ